MKEKTHIWNVSLFWVFSHQLRKCRLEYSPKSYIKCISKTAYLKKENIEYNKTKNSIFANRNSRNYWDWMNLSKEANKIQKQMLKTETNSKKTKHKASE